MVAEALYREYVNAYGYALDAQCEDFDTGPLFGRAAGMACALEGHLRRAFDMKREDVASFWDFMKAGFDVSTAIDRLMSEQVYRDQRETIHAVMYAGAR
jgi:hypothetical protein